MATDTADSPVHKITARSMTAWFFALLAVFNALGAILYLHVSLVFFVVAFVVACPPVRRAIESEANVHLSTPAAAIIYAIVTVVGNLWFLASAVGA